MGDSATQARVEALLAAGHEHIRAGRLADAAQALREAAALLDAGEHGAMARLAEEFPESLPEPSGG